MDKTNITRAQKAALDKRKVGILTLIGRYNYGNRLQNYATEQIYLDMGFSPVTLDSVRPCYQEVAASIIRKARGWSKTGDASMSQQRLDAFDRFNTKLNIQTVRLCDKRLVDEYSYFSVGSDQVWNLNLMQHRTKWFFLEFVNRNQRIALAPSIGLDQLNAQQKKEIARGVEGFDLLSIREERGAELIKECSGKSAEVICDPTLVLRKQQWLLVSDDRLTPSCHYLFAYILGEKDIEVDSLISRLASFYELSLVSLSDKERPGEPPAGPSEFISLIANAKHVVTDSFHAAVFSAIFHRPLTIVQRKGGADTFSRLSTLARKLGIENKIYGSSGYSPSTADDYASVDDAIEQERSIFIGYLNRCLE